MSEALFKMRHHGKQFEVSRKLYPTKNPNTIFLVKRSLWGMRGLGIHGVIRGNLSAIDGGVLFEVYEAERLRLGKIFPVRGLIKEVMAEIVDRGVVTRWHSSMYQTEDGENLYKRLRDDPRLSITEIPSSSGIHINVVTRRRNNVSI